MTTNAVEVKKQNTVKPNGEQIFIPFGKSGLSLPSDIWENRKRLTALRKMIDSQIALIRDDEELALK